MSKPMTKIEALKAAQEMQVIAANNGKMFCLDFDGELKCWELSDVCDDEIIVDRFHFEDQKPLAQDALAIEKKSGLYLRATGGLNTFYPPGYCSKNYSDESLKKGIIVSDQYEIIETPTDFETMQTPDEMCMWFKCKKYIKKYSVNGTFLLDDCERCRISVSEPSGLKGE